MHDHRNGKRKKSDFKNLLCENSLQMGISYYTHFMASALPLHCFLNPFKTKISQPENTARWPGVSIYMNG